MRPVRLGVGSCCSSYPTPRQRLWAAAFRPKQQSGLDIRPCPQTLRRRLRRPERRRLRRVQQGHGQQRIVVVEVLEDLGGASRGQGVSLSRRGLCMLAASLGAICTSSPRAHALTHSGLGAVPSRACASSLAISIRRSCSSAARAWHSPALRSRPSTRRASGGCASSVEQPVNRLALAASAEQHLGAPPHVQPSQEGISPLPATEATPPSSPSQIGMQALVAGATTRESGWGLPEASVPPAA